MWKKKINDTRRIGIVYVQEWFDQEFPNSAVVQFRDFVVGEWSEYEDGKIEKDFPYAICRKMDDALIIFKEKIRLYGINE